MENLNQNNRKLIIIWIDKNIDNKENQEFLNQLQFKNKQIYYDPINSGINFEIYKDETNIIYDIYEYKSIESSIDFLKKIKFKETIIIVSGSLFVNFVEMFQKNLKDIYVIPKIIVFTSKNRDLSLPKSIKNEKFYTFGGIETSFDRIKYFIESGQKEIEECPNQNKNLISSSRNLQFGEKLIFEQVKDKKDLMLPTFFKIQLDKSNTEDNIAFIANMYNNYKNEPEYYKLLNQIKNFQDIPIELLSKYYAKIYTIEGNFYKKMKVNLLNDNINNNIYLPYIKTLYEGLEKGALKPCIDKELYSAQILSEEEINDLIEQNNNKLQDLPMSIIFSKSFLSFSKDKNKAKEFLSKGKNAMLTIVRDEDQQYDLFTQADIEEISCFPEEKEVLFFPFSAFGINKFSYESDKIYNIELKYLGRYIQDFVNDKKITTMYDEIPNTDFKKLFKKSGLVQENKINNMKINDIQKEYIKYKESKNNTSNKKKILIPIIIAIIIAISLLSLIFNKKSEDSKGGTKGSNISKCPEGSYFNSNTSNCLPCNSGYYSNDDSTICIKCEAGTYSKEGSSECIKCPEGTYSNSSSSLCIDCPAGTYSYETRKYCVECSKGYFSKTSGSSECIKCPDGYISNITGATSCTICPAGTYSYFTRESCIECIKGYYSNKTGATECIECPDGYISNITGATSCTICPVGTYENVKKQCISCPKGYYSNKTGVMECIECPDGYISNITGATSCTICPVGTYEYTKKECISCSKGYYSNKTGAT